MHILKRNLRVLSEAEYKYVLGARVKNEPNDIKGRILAMGLDCGQTAVITRTDGNRLIYRKQSGVRPKTDSTAKGDSASFRGVLRQAG